MERVPLLTRHVKTLLILGLACLVMGLFIGNLHAAEATTGFNLIQILARPQDENTSLFTVMALIPVHEKQTGTAELLLPAGITVLGVVGYDEIEDETLGEVDYTVKAAVNGIDDLYTFTLTEGAGIIMSFTEPRSLYDTDAMPGNAPLASFGLEAVYELSTLTVAFASPEGMVGEGEGVARIGHDEEGHVMYGIAFENVLKGESRVATIAFAKPTDISTVTEAEDFFVRNQFLLVVGGILLVIIALIALVVSLFLRANKRQAVDEKSSESDADGLHF